MVTVGRSGIMAQWRLRHNTGPVEHDADQHHRDHDEGALRRHFGARQQQIKRRHEQRGEGGPLLDRGAIGKPWDERKAGAEDEEDQPGDHRHVIAGNRQHVADAGNKHRVIEMRIDRVPPPVDQHRGDGAWIAVQHGANAGIDGIAHPLDHGIGAAQQPLLRGRRDDFDSAADEARRADALEIKIAGKIVATGFERLQRRIEQRLGLDERAWLRRHAALDRKPHPLRLLVHAAAVHPLDAQHKAIAMLALLAQLDKARHRHARGGEAQHRMIDQRRLHGGDGEAQGNAQRAERDRERNELTPQQHG
jgi:hypothetical protein